MKVVINQSNYLPWKGYFDLINDADLFIFYDDLQFTKNDWRNRNRLKTAHGPAWLTIPVGKDQNRLICEVVLPATDWAHRHWKLIELHYRGAPFFDDFAPFFYSTLVERSWATLSELNQFLIRKIAVDFLGVKVRFADSRTYHLRTRKQDRVLELLQAVGATTYISGPAAKAYLDAAVFSQVGVELIWKDYQDYPEYTQFHPPFEHAVSILDLLFHAGPAAADYIWGWRSRILP